MIWLNMYKRRVWKVITNGFTKNNRKKLKRQRKLKLRIECYACAFSFE